MASIKTIKGKKGGIAYKITVSNGYRPDGSKIFKTATWHPDPARTEKQNEKDLNDFVAVFEAKVRGGNYLDGGKTPFKIYAAQWIETVAPANVQPNTLQSYKDLLRIHIIPAIGNVKLANLTPSRISSLCLELSKGRKDGVKGGYSDATIRRVRALISSILSSAAADGAIKDNPCRNVKKIRSTEIDHKQRFFTVNQAKTFLGSLEELHLQMQVFFNMALYGGMRRSELLALDWDDIDFQNNQVRINKAYVKEGSKPIIKVPKSKNSKRNIPLLIIDKVKTLLYQLKEEQEQYKISLGNKWRGDNCVFIQWDGLRMYPDTPSAAFSKAITKHNETDPEHPLPEISLHALRHTSASLLIEMGIPISVISKILGHSRISTTTDFYIDTSEKSYLEAITAMGDLLK